MPFVWDADTQGPPPPLAELREAKRKAEAAKSESSTSPTSPTPPPPPPPLVHRSSARILGKRTREVEEKEEENKVNARKAARAPRATVENGRALAKRGRKDSVKVLSDSNVVREAEKSLTAESEQSVLSGKSPLELLLFVV